MEIGKQGVMALMQRGLDRHPPLITEDWEESRELLESGVFFYKTTLEYVPAGSGSLCSLGPPVSGPLSSSYCSYCRGTAFVPALQPEKAVTDSRASSCQLVHSHSIEKEVR
jgi:hypothetical protein